MRRRGDHSGIDRRLQRERPKPRDEFASSLADRLAPEPVSRRSLWQTAVAAGFTLMLILALALTGGAVYAASAVQGGTAAIASFVTASSSSKPDKPEQANQGGQANSQSSESNAQAGAQGAEDKVTICHVPPGNPDNPQTITIGASAVDAHFEEHPDDSLGPCADDPSPPDDQYEDKVLICHIPPGNPENAHTIRVSENAVPAHLAHGDSEGPCED